MLDIAKIKADSLIKQDVAKKKIEAAKRSAEEKKSLKAYPLPKYVKRVPMTGNAEVDSKADLDEVQAGFRKRAADENARFALATDTEYWACLCFQTREQKDAFLAALDILQFGDRYLDGQLVAKKLGVSLPDADVPYKTSDKPDPAWVEFVK